MSHAVLILDNLSDDKIHSQIPAIIASMFRNTDSTAVFTNQPGCQLYPPDREWMEQVALAMACDVLASGEDNIGFHLTLEKKEVATFWQEQLNLQNRNGSAKELYLYIYANYFKDYCSTIQSASDMEVPHTVTINDFISGLFMDAAQSMEAYKELLMDEKYINNTAKVFQDNWDKIFRKLFCSLYKLNYLIGNVNTKGAFYDNSINSSIIEFWICSVSKEINGADELKSLLSDLHKGFGSRYFHFSFDNSYARWLFKEDIINAIYSDTEIYRENTKSRTVIKYGKKVLEWLENGQGKKYYNGLKPNNEHIIDPPGCFAPNTQIMLHDGSFAAIKDLREGHRLLSKDGTVSTVSNEHRLVTSSQWGMIELWGFICHDLENDKILDFEPFFTKDQIFLTSEGWKSIDAEDMRYKSFSEVRRLDQGDTIYKVIRSYGEKLKYSKLRILSFTSKEKSGEMFCLHIYDGHPSLHANGLLMGMNFFAITEKMMEYAFNSLTIDEKQYVINILKPVLPTISEMIGIYVAQPLNRIFNIGE